MNIKRKAKRNRLHIHSGHNNLRLLLCCIAAYISIFLTACNEGSSAIDNDIPEESTVFNVTQEQEQEWVYVPEMVTIADMRADYGKMQVIGDSICYISMNGETENNTQSICRYSITDGELIRISIDWPMEGKNREISAYFFDQDYSVWLIVNVYSADYSQLQRYLCKFDPEGKSIISREITEQLGRGIAINSLAIDGQGQIYVFSVEAGILLYTGDGSYHGSIAYDFSENVQVKGTVNGEDNKFYVCISKGENSDHCTLMEVDFERKQLIEFIEDFPNINGLCAGKGSGVDSAGQYDLLLYDDVLVYRYDFSTHKTEELLIWADSDVNGYFVKSFGILGDGRYYCMVDDWKNDDRSVVLLGRTRAEEAPQRINMVLAAVNGGSDLAAMAVRFNRNNHQYHLTVQNYDSLTDLYNAILAKKAVDIIDLSGVDLESLFRQGVFEDLTPYLEQSKAFGPSDFLDGILDVYTFDGTLVGIPESFTMRTVVGDRMWLGNNTGLTLDGLLTAAERNPDALPFGEITKEEMMQYVMIFNEDAFIDWDTGECHFDSEAFRAILELVNRFPDSAGNEQEEASLPSKIQNGEVLFAIAEIKRLTAFQLYEGMFGENAACIGFPTTDGKGGTLLFADNIFGIVSTSENKSGAWEFIESVLEQKNVDDMEAEDIYILYRVPDRFPTLKKIMNVIIEYKMEDDRAWADKGNRFTTVYYDDGWTFTYHEVTWDEINEILDLLKEAKASFSVEDNQVIKIINEEAFAYYSGQKQVEDVISVIQTRIQLYVNENI